MKKLSIDDRLDINESRKSEIVKTLKKLENEYTELKNELNKLEDEYTELLEEFIIEKEKELDDAPSVNYLIGNKIMDKEEIIDLVEFYQNKLEDFELSMPVDAQLNYVGWGQNSNLLLLCSKENKSFCLSVSPDNGYKPQDKSLCFKNEDLIDKDIHFSLLKTKEGHFEVLSAELK